MSIANPADSNTDQVKQTDRRALGNQPDFTPATGGDSAGGGGGGGGSGFQLITTATSGTINLNLTTDKNYLTVMSGNVAYVDSARLAGTVSFLTLTNPGATRTVSWPAWTMASGALPTTIYGGTSLTVMLNSTGTTVGAVYATLDGAYPQFAPGTYGNAASIPVLTFDNSGRLNSITPTPIVGLTRGLIFPEDYGAVGNGAANDSAALAAAIAATTQGKILVLTQTYGIGTAAIQISCDVWGTPGSGFNPSAAGGSANGVRIVAGCRQAKFGLFSNFSGYAVNVETSTVAIDIQEIAVCGTGVAFVTNGFNNDVRVTWIGSCTNCFSVANGSSTTGLQGNRITCNFGVGSTLGLLFDGSANCDSNELTFGSWDPVAVANSRAFYNSNGSGLGNALSNWKLRVEDWCGFAAASGKFAEGAFTSCRFYCANIGGNNAALNDWSFFNISGAAQNTYESENLTGSAAAVQAAWQVAANNRAAFLATVQYSNSVYCTGVIPGGGINAGGALAVYVYSPFTDGTFTNFRVNNISNLGLVLTSAVETGAFPNEVLLVFTNAGNGAIAAGTTFDFIFVSGLP